MTAAPLTPGPPALSFAWLVFWAGRGHEALLSAIDALGSGEEDAGTARRILLLKRAVARTPFPGSTGVAAVLSALFEEMAGHDAPWVLAISASESPGTTGWRRWQKGGRRRSRRAPGEAGCGR